MTFQIGLLLAITLITLGLLAWEKISADVVALAMLLTLVLCGLLPPDKAFAGFSSDTVIMILGLLLLTTALVRTGVIDLVGRPSSAMWVPTQYGSFLLLLWPLHFSAPS